MPPVRSTKPANKATPEEQRIAKALRGLKDGTFKNPAVAARAQHVPYNKLLRRSNGTKPIESNGGHNKVLSTVQEQALLLYIDRCEELGRPCKRKHITIGTNTLLALSGASFYISKCWTTRFIKRTKCLRHRTKPLSVQRKAAQKWDDIELHFEKFKRRYKELNMKPENLHNFDETGFRIGYLAGQIVFTRTDRQVYISDPDNRELVTSMESISSIGTTTDPMIIMPGQQMKEKHFPKGLNNGIRIGVSESGYTNDRLSFEWLKHFDLQTRPLNGEWRMLVMDGHGSHLTIEFVEYCYHPDVKISVFLLPAYSTYLLQPLDIGVFQSFKHYHQEVLEDSICYRGLDFKHQDFLAAFQRMRNLTFKKPIILSAFQKSGLLPFNPAIVLAKLGEFGTPERTLEADNSGSELGFEVDFQRAITPISPRIYKVYSEYINKKLAWSIEEGLILTPTTGKLIAKREKANKTIQLNGKLAIEELFKRRQAELDKIQPNGERIVQQFETILVGDARLRTMTRDLEEERKIDALAAKKAESLRKKREYKEGVEKRREERLAKKAEKQARKDTRMAQLASLVSRPSRRTASTQ
jgi:hypothetical protein